MRILRALAMDGPQRLKELSESVGYGSSTTLRFLRILRDDGYVEQGPDRVWRASMELWRLGAAVLAHGGLSLRLNETVQTVAQKTGETSAYVTYVDGDIVYLALALSRHTVRTHIELGTRLHASEVSTGRAILAHLPCEEVEGLMLKRWGPDKWASKYGHAFRDRLLDIRSKGYSSAKSERWPGVWGIGVPVMDAVGRPVGALGISVPPNREPDDERKLGALLQSHAALLAGAVRS